MNKLDTGKRGLILQLLTEGVGVNATTRIVRCAKNTVLKLLRDAGAACAAYQDYAFRDLECRRVQAEELWSFLYAKRETNVANPEAGDVWLWVAICEDSKLVASWWIGDRSYETGYVFMRDLASRMARPIQLTTDGHSVHLDAVDDAFADWMVEHRVLKRNYPNAKIGRTAHVERQNLTMRMSTRRFQRATNTFSKTLENHAHAVALNYMAYNFVRPDGSLAGRTPAQAVGVAKRRWSYEDIIRLIDSK